MSGQEFDASQSQGLIYNPQEGVGVNQQFGDRSNTDTGGGDSAGRDVDKRVSLQIFNIAVSSEPSGTSSQQSIQQLIQILGQMGNGEGIQSAYQEALPVDSHVSRPEAVGTEAIVSQLQDFRKLLEFVVQLMGDRDTPQPIQKQLENWMQQWQGTEQKQQSGTVTPLKTRFQSYLQLAVVSLDFSPDEFIINGWLIPDDSAQDTAKRFQKLDLEHDQSGTPCSLEQVPEMLDKFLNESLRLLRGKRYDLTIEVFLPLNYLCTEIDRWKLNDPVFGQEYLLGTEYRVIVRSSDRLKPYYLERRWDKWCNNWERLQQCWHKAPDMSDFEHLTQLDHCNWKRFRNNLAQKLGLKLTCGLMESQQRELFTSVLMAAAPIAIWIRRDLPHLDPGAEMDELLGKYPLLELVEKVRQKRTDADTADFPEDHLGSHLALMWEDPNRIPEVSQLIPTGQ
jgi:hypothetical protein